MLSSISKMNSRTVKQVKSDLFNFQILGFSESLQVVVIGLGNGMTHPPTDRTEGSADIYSDFLAFLVDLSTSIGSALSIVVCHYFPTTHILTAKCATNAIDFVTPFRLILRHGTYFHKLK